MFKFIERQLDIKLIKTSFVFAFIYCILFNSAVFLFKFEYYQANMLTAIFELIKDFIYVMITLFVFFFGLSVHRLAFIIGSLFLFVTGAVASYYLFFFSISPTLSMMPVFFGSHPTEIYELLSVRIMIWVMFSILICLYSIKHFNVQTTKSFFTRILAALCLLIIINNIIAPKFSFLKTYFPVQYLHNSYVYFFGKSSSYAREDISTKYKFADYSEDDVIGVLVIGESARYSNFGINGYERDTTPLLSKIDGLASYKARSCAATTYQSVPCMLSRYGEENLDLVERETSAMSVLTSLGFETVWLGTQSLTKYYRNKKGGSFYDEVNFHAIPGGSLVFLPNDLDEKMLPYLDQYIEGAGKKFIVVHTTGSHWNYSLRHTKEFAKFKPEINNSIKRDAAGCSTEELVNSYDNSILYTDFFLSSVIERLKDKKSFFIYTSDHGESLGECRRYGHGASDYIQEQREVPMIVWASDSLKASNPKKWKSLDAVVSNEISHDYIFHSILDCIGIESEVVDKSLSVCSRGLGD